jgi:hypothetical protein
MSINLYEDLSAFRVVYRDICSSTILKRILFISIGTRLCILLTATYEDQQCAAFSFSLYFWTTIRKKIYKHKDTKYIRCFYAFFWVISRRLNFICRRFGTLFYLHGRVGMKNDLVIVRTYQPMKMEQSVPKRRHIKFRRRQITQKKAYNIQNTANVWNEFYKVLISFVRVLLCLCPMMVSGINGNMYHFLENKRFCLKKK